MKLFFSTILLFFFLGLKGQSLTQDNIYAPGPILTPDPLPKYIPADPALKIENQTQYPTINNTSIAPDDYDASLRNALSNIPVNSAQTKAFTPITYQDNNIDIERFLKSPCYKEIGVTPNTFSDFERLEKIYQDCEDEKNKIKLPDLKDVDLGKILLFLSLSGVCIFYFWKGYKGS